MLETIIYYGPLIVPLSILLGYFANKFYFSGAVCKSTNRLDGKVVIITGANTGIGYETALDLAKRGAKVVLACRDLKRAQEACDKIMLETDSKTVYVERVDLASMESIREFAKNFKSKFNRLDILINNAGLTLKSRMETKDGFEMCFGTMHLGHFLLTGLLIDLLKSSAPSRIVNVSSLAHFGTSLDFDDLQMKKDYERFRAYRRCKLANCLFTRELARKFGANGITSVSLHPGVVNSDINREMEANREWLWILSMIFRPFVWMLFKTIRQGAQTTIHCAIDDDVPNHNGDYFRDCEPSRCSAQSKDETSARKLWEISKELTKISY